MQLTTRSYQPGDAAALTAFLNYLDAYAGAEAGLSDDDTHTLLSTQTHDVAQDTVLTFDPHGALIAATVLLAPPAGGYRINLVGGVHPQWRGRGLGRRLLDEQLTRAEQVRRLRAPRADWQAHAAVPVTDADSPRLYRRFGLAPVRYWSDMKADPAGAPELALPDGIVAAPYSAEDDWAVHAAHMEAFTDHWGYQRREFDDWVALTVHSSAFQAQLSLVARDGDAVAGYVLCYGDPDPAQIYIGHVGVRAPWRRRGLAGALLARTLRTAHRLGYRTAALSVDAQSPTGAVGVYQRVGFTVAHQGVTYSRDLPAIR
ncbi:MAG: GNAT family N-acetyltransferase [Micromonosporaceae bacterium]